jgi:small-conductance mechanosensitive channel/CRP-like cAMP-binding protein
MTAERKTPSVPRRLATATAILVVVVGAVWFLHIWGISTTERGKDYGTLAMWIAGAFLATRIFDVLLFDLVLRGRSRVAVPALLRQIVDLFIFGVCVAVVFKMVFPGVELGGLLVSSAILTAVIGLALQDTLGNLFAGLALHLERAVQVGDLIRSGETFGVVEEISWRTIRLHTTEGNVLLIPNSVAGRERLEIFPHSERPIARFLRIGLDAQASPVAVRETLEAALRGMPGIVAHPAPTAYLRSFDAYAVTYELRYWPEDYARYLEVDSAVRERVWFALHRAGIRIPYPIAEHHEYLGGPLAAPERHVSVEEVLAGVDLFAALTPDEREQLAAGARERRYAPGEIIVREGDETSSMFVVEQGRAAVSIHGAAGDTRKLATLEPGAAFGEISLLTGERRTATVRAVTEVLALEIGKSTLSPVLEANPALCEAFELVIVERRRGVSELFDASRLDVARLEESPLPGRIARFFGLKRRA